MSDRPLPHPTELSRPFWQALARDEFVLMRCDDCGHFLHPPQHICARCHGSAMHWEPVGRTGTLYTYTIVHRAPGPAFTAKLPYAVGVAEIDGTDTRMLSNVLGDVDRIAVGMPVQVVTEKVTDELGLFYFRDAGDAGEEATL